MLLGDFKTKQYLLITSPRGRSRQAAHAFRQRNNTTTALTATPRGQLQDAQSPASRPAPARRRCPTRRRPSGLSRLGVTAARGGLASLARAAAPRWRLIATSGCGGRRRSTIETTECRSEWRRRSTPSSRCAPQTSTGIWYRGAGRAGAPREGRWGGGLAAAAWGGAGRRAGPCLWKRDSVSCLRVHRHRPWEMELALFRLCWMFGPVVSWFLVSYKPCFCTGDRLSKG